MAIFGKIRMPPAQPKRAVMFGAIPERMAMMGAADVGSPGMTPMVSDNDTDILGTVGVDRVNDLRAEDVGVSLPTRSVRDIPRFSYTGPEFSGLDKFVGAMRALQGFDDGGKAFDRFMADADEKQRGRYDEAMDNFDALKKRESRDQILAGINPEMRDLFEIAQEFAPNAAIEALMPKPGQYSYKDGVVLNERTGDVRRVQPEIRTSAPGTELFTVDPVTGELRIVHTNRNFAPNRSTRPPTPTLGANEEWEE